MFAVDNKERHNLNNSDEDLQPRGKKERQGREKNNNNKNSQAEKINYI